MTISRTGTSGRMGSVLGLGFLVLGLLSGACAGELEDGLGANPRTGNVVDKQEADEAKVEGATAAPVVSPDNASTTIAVTGAISGCGDVSTLPPGTAPRNENECRACYGDWGLHGISTEESCNCGTSDGGKRCTDGDDCEGMCIAAEEEPEFDVLESGPPSHGFFVGRCSDFVTVYGCFRLINEGARDDGPVPASETPKRICVD